MRSFGFRICQVPLKLTYYDSEIASIVESKINIVRSEMNVMNKTFVEVYEIESRMESSHNIVEAPLEGKQVNPPTPKQITLALRRIYRT